MISVNAYIDGFNLYHAIHRLNDPRLKWYNIKILVQRYLQSKDSLRNIYFYTAKPEHCNERVQERFLKYTKALQEIGINIVLGKFKRKEKNLNITKIFTKRFSAGKEEKKFLSPQTLNSNCKYFYLGHEEKETDVNIALDLIDHAHQNICDKFVLVTGDSDLKPAVNRILKNFSKKKRMAVRVQRSLDLAAYAKTKLVEIGVPAWRNENAITVVFPAAKKELKEKWQLATANKISHIIIMPHLTKKKIDEFISDFKKSI